MLNKVNGSAAVKVISPKVFYLSLTRHRGRKVISYLTSTEVIVFNGMLSRVCFELWWLGWTCVWAGSCCCWGHTPQKVLARNLGLLIRDTVAWCSTCWESGKSKLSSSVWGMMQQTNFSEESRNFKYQGTEIEGIREILALITYTIRNLC